MSKTKQEKSEQLINTDIKPTDEGWTQHVLSTMSVKEKFGERPKCDGLRRVFNILIGEIIESCSKVIQPANEQNVHRCTIEHTIKYIKHGDAMGRIRIVTDCVDVSTINTSDPYNRYPTASAATMAEGRALKKALMLVNVQTAEEMTSLPPEATQNTSNIKPNQKNLIIKSATDQGISVEKMMGEMLEAKKISGNSLQGMSYTDAQKMIEQLSRYNDGPDNGGDVVPESILIN